MACQYHRKINVWTVKNIRTCRRCQTASVTNTLSFAKNGTQASERKGRGGGGAHTAPHIFFCKVRHNFFYLSIKSFRQSTTPPPPHFQFAFDATSSHDVSICNGINSCVRMTYLYTIITTLTQRWGIHLLHEQKIAGGGGVQMFT